MGQSRQILAKELAVLLLVILSVIAAEAVISHHMDLYQKTQIQRRK
jgi:hypothetical protein